MLRSMSLPLDLLFLAALAAGLCAQPAAPFARTGDAFVTDPSSDTVWRLQDLNLDGDFNDAGEVIAFYDDVNGTIDLQLNNGVAVGPDGTVYVADAGSDIVVALFDQNGDGDAVDSGEHWVFFDGDPTVNPAGIDMAAAANLSVDDAGVVWVATANNGGGGIDAVIRLEDLGGNPGAVDAGEATVFAQFAIGGPTGDSVPQDVLPGPGGFLYYLEGASSGSTAKGIYRLHDDNPQNGVIDGPQEISAYWLPTAGTGAFLWGAAIDSAGALYVADTGSDTIWKLLDQNADFSIANGTAEEVPVWSSVGTSLVWKVVPESSGSLLVAESQTPDRILRMTDDVVINGNFNDPGEVVEVYNDLLGPADIVNPRSIALARAPTLTAPSMPSVSAPFDLHFDAVGGSPFTLWVSNLLAPTTIAPFGTLDILVTPPAFAGPVLGGNLPLSGRLTIPIPAVGTGLFGVTAHLQALGGPITRLQFSNVASLTFQL